MIPELGQYFTLDPSSALLARSLTTRNPKKFVDLGCGDGALASAMLDRWPKAKGICLDISHQDGFNLNKKFSNINYSLVDILTPDFDKFFSSDVSDVDVIVSNPPFIKRSVDGYISDVFQSVGLHDVVDVMAPRYSTHYAFLAQSLRLVKDHGEIAIILPESFVSGDKYRNARSALFERYNLVKVLELSPGSFIKTEAKCYILYLKTGGPTESVMLKAANTPDSYEVSVRDGINRLDYKYYRNQSSGLCFSYKESKNNTLQSLEDLGFEVLRGNRTGKQVRLSGVSYCHTDTINEAEKKHSKMIRFKAFGPKINDSFGKEVIVKPGDIVISRVGSRVVGKIALVTEGEAILTDCVFRLRPTNDLAKAHVPILLSDDTASFLKEIARGTCARYLTFDDIRKLKIHRVV